MSSRVSVRDKDVALMAFKIINRKCILVILIMFIFWSFVLALLRFQILAYYSFFFYPYLSLFMR